MEDHPSNADEFGAHRRLAETTADLIRSTDGPKQIGLTGKWGSGKSTVVELLRGELEEKQTLFYVFDAWEHRGDPLRRSFLEGFEEACSDKWGKSAIAEGSIVQPDEKIEETTPISWTGAIFLFSLLLLPLGFALISDWISNASAPISLGWDAQSWKLLIGFGFTLAPGLVALSELFIHPKARDQEIRQLLLRRPPRVVTRVLRSWEVSSIEFRRRFDATLAAAFRGRRTDRRIVLILDNLDRLAVGDALAAWSTLQALLPRPSHGDTSHQEGLWVVIPFDPTALMKGGSLTNETIDSAIDKTLAGSFRVPPVIVPSWKKFTMKRLASAMPDHEAAHLEAAYRVLRTAMFSSATHSLPSPRETITAINRIGALHRQWCGTIPLDEIAYFVGRCENRWTALGVDLEQLGSLGERAKWMMALWTGSDPDDAAHQLLGEQVEAAFVSDQPELLRELANVPGSQDVAEAVFEERLVEWRDEPDTFMTVVHKLTDSEISEWLSRSIWVGVARAFSSIPIHLILDPDFSSDVSACLDQMDEQTGSTARANLASVLLFNTQDLEHDAEQLAAWAKSLSVLGRAHVIEKGSAIPFQTDTAFALALELRDQPDTLLSIDRDNIVRGLTGTVESENAPFHDDPSWIVEQLEPSDSELSALLDAADRGLRHASGPEHYAARVSTALTAVDMLGGPREHPRLLASSLHCLMVAIQAESWTEAAGLMGLALLTGHRRVEPEEPMGHTNNGHQELDRLLEQPARRPILEPLRSDLMRRCLWHISSLAVEQPRFRGLIVESIKGLKDENWEPSPVTAEALRLLAPELRQTLDANQQARLVSTVALMPANHGFLTTIDLADDVALIQMAGEIKTAPPCDEVIALLQNAKEDDWLRLLQVGTEAASATAALAESCNIHVSTELGSALKSVASDAITNDRTVDRESVRRLSAILHGSTLASVRRQTWELLEANPGDSGRLLNGFGHLLLLDSSLESRLNNLLATDAVALLVDGDTHVLQWLIHALESSKLNKKAAEASRTVVTTQIQAGAEAERLGLLGELRDLLAS